MRFNLQPTTYNLQPSRGFSLLELLAYVAVLSIMLVVVVNTSSAVTGAYARARVERNISVGGSMALERMLREIRLADSIQVSGSTLGVSPGILKLQTVLASGSQTPTTRTFLLDSPTSSVLIGEEDGSLKALTSKVKVTRLAFYRIGGGLSPESVRVELSVQDGFGLVSQSQNFYGTATLRRSY